MTQVRWNEYLATGNEIVDEQHRSLFALFNELHDCVAQGHCGEQVDEVISRLQEYVLFHFSSEEDLMSTSGYPGSEVISHLAAHRQLGERVDEIVSHRDAGDLAAIQALTILMYEWLNEHIEQVDRRLADYLKEHA